MARKPSGASPVMGNGPASSEKRTGKAAPAGAVGGLPPLPRQRRRRMVMLAVLLVAAGALLTAYVVAGLDERASVVVVARDVPVGAQLTAADLTTSDAVLEGGLATIPGRQVREVIGRVAAVGLRRGTVLAPSQLTGALSPRPGQQVVPIALRLAQLPARELVPGDQVLLVPTPAAAGRADNSSEGGSAPLGQDILATVDQVSDPDADGMVRLDVVVDARVGPAVARQASTGRLGLVLIAREPR